MIKHKQQATQSLRISLLRNYLKMFGYDNVAVQNFLQEEEEADAAVEAMLVELASSSDEEIEDSRGGSRPGKAPNKNRDFVGAFSKLVNDYFNGTESVYNESDFERRFRMPRSVFNRVWTSLEGTDPFIQKRDVTGKMGIHPLCRITAVLRFLAYGDAYDRDDENLYISETSLVYSVKLFCKLLKRIHGERYLNRCPTMAERMEIATQNAAKGFPGCIGSWDCKHFPWKNCPVRLAGQHKGHAEGGKKTLILESVADHRRYIWYMNFGDPGSLNDLNVLDKSSIVGSMLSGSLNLTIAPYTVNGRERDWAYFLVDGIYPEWAIFVKTFSEKHGHKKKVFGDRQEAVRKDIECAFGILVQKFQVLSRPLRGWFLDELKDILDACVILHNMVVEERTNSRVENVGEEVATRSFPLFGKAEVTAEQAAADGVDLFAARVSRFAVAMESNWEHFELKRDLVEHVNDRFG